MINFTTFVLFVDRQTLSLDVSIDYKSVFSWYFRLTLFEEDLQICTYIKFWYYNILFKFVIYCYKWYTRVNTYKFLLLSLQNNYDGGLFHF